MGFDADELLGSMVDTHCHVQNDTSDDPLQTETTKDLIWSCREGGMRGVVLKAHGWPAVRLARELDAACEGFRVYPSVTLNSTAGGPYPWVVEMAWQLGARYVWLPTWSALNDRNSRVSFTRIMVDRGYNGFFKDIPESGFYTGLDEEGSLKRNVRDVVDLCKEHDLVLGTGHGSTAEALAVARYAKSVGFERLVFTHPHVGISDVTDEQVEEFVSCGGHIELCMLETEPFSGCMTAERWVRICKTVGYDHCLISSDHFWGWKTTIPEQFRSFLTRMHDAGASMGDLSAMVEVPRRLLEA